MLYLAIDQHSKQLTVNLRNEAGTVLLRRQVSTRGESPWQFLEDVRQRSLAEGGYVAIVEVCGFNSIAPPRAFRPRPPSGGSRSSRSRRWTGWN